MVYLREHTQVRCKHVRRMEAEFEYVVQKRGGEKIELFVNEATRVDITLAGISEDSVEELRHKVIGDEHDRLLVTGA